MDKKHNFVIVSDDKIVIDQKKSKILTEFSLKREEIELIKFDMSEVSISSVIEELDTYNFLASCKVVVCEHCSFLEGESNKELKYLTAYLTNPSTNFLIMCTAKISEKKEIKELLPYVEVIESGISSEVLVKNNLHPCTMENKTVKYLVEYCLGNNEKILNELEKLKCYKLGEPNKMITMEDIDQVVIKEYDEDIFDLVNAIARRQKAKAFSIYGRIIEKEKDAVNIIASIASQIRLLYSVKVLSSEKLSINQIASIVNVKPRAASIALENCDNFSEKKLLSLLNRLAEIDYRTKSGSAQGNLSFEMFLMSI